jgi:hypothetical protein
MVGFILRWLCGHESSFLIFFFLSCCIMERSKHGVWDLVFACVWRGRFCIMGVRTVDFLGRIFFGVVVGPRSGGFGQLSVPQCNHIQLCVLSWADFLLFDYSH